MRRGWAKIGFLLVLCAACAGGCAGPRPLTLRTYSRNVVVSRDGIMRYESTRIDHRQLRSELVKRLVTDDTPITVHVHESVPVKAFDTIVVMFREAGFRRVTYVVYADVPAR